jgi:hypothetical protein
MVLATNKETNKTTATAVQPAKAKNNMDRLTIRTAAALVNPPAVRLTIHSAPISPAGKLEMSAATPKAAATMTTALIVMVNPILARLAKLDLASDNLRPLTMI